MGESGHVLGIDLAPTMVVETSAEIKQRGLTQAKMQLMDGDAIDFEAETFDVVTCEICCTFSILKTPYPRF